jgi:hypothetical protein
VVVPLDADCFTVDVACELLQYGLAVPCTLDILEIVSHLIEELLLVDSAIEFPESFVALVVSYSATTVSTTMSSQSMLLTLLSRDQAH